MTSKTPIRVLPLGSIAGLIEAIPFRIGLLMMRAFAGGSAKAKVLRGSTWTVVGFGSGQLLRLGSNMILTRLLFPEDFGLMALVNVFLLGLEMLSDIGVNASIIQNKRGSEASFLCTAWTLQIIRGAFLWVCACVIAWPAAWFYEEPQLRYMIPVAGIAVLILGFQTTGIPLHNRQMLLGRITLLQLLAQVISLCVMILLAWQLRSVWALILGNVFGAAVQVVLAHWMIPGIKHRLTIERSCAVEIVRFGKWLFFATALGYLAGHASDKLVMGKLMDKGALGIYTIAFMLSQMPTAIMQTLMERVLYPTLAKGARENSVNFRETLRQSRDLIWPPFLLIVSTLAFFGPILFETFWQPRYHTAGWMVQMLLIGVWFGGLNSSLNAALLATGDSFASAIQNTIVVSVGVPCMILGCLYWGVFGLILGMVAGKTLAHVVLHVMLSRRGFDIWRQDIRAHLMMAMVAIFVSSSCGHCAIFRSGSRFSIGRVADGDGPAVMIALGVTSVLLFACIKLFLREHRSALA